MMVQLDDNQWKRLLDAWSELHPEGWPDASMILEEVVSCYENEAKKEKENEFTREDEEDPADQMARENIIRQGEANK